MYSVSVCVCPSVFRIRGDNFRKEKLYINVLYPKMYIISLNSVSPHISQGTYTRVILYVTLCSSSGAPYLWP